MVTVLKRFLYILLLFLSSSLAIVSCQAGYTLVPSQIHVTIHVAGEDQTLAVPDQSTTQDALVLAGISLGPLDRTDIPLAQILTNNQVITVTRVVENFVTAEASIPFQSQTIKNETLPDGETYILQPGVNGTQLVTFKVVLENGLETSRTEYKTEITTLPQPEIIMIGVQSPFIPQEISGVIAYLQGGNAWLIEGNTGQRRPVVTSGDLDGRVLKLSPDREWLLYSRSSANAGQGINSLWVIRLNREKPTPLNLQITNVISFADWIPNNNNTIAYSTVEPRENPPGWQSNNDLFYKSFFPDGTLGSAIKVLGSSTGGIYGWWGTTFNWSKDGSRLAYARPDSIGTVNFANNGLNELLAFDPYDTKGDWAWVPGISWSPTGDVLFTASPVTQTDTQGLGDSRYGLRALLMNPSSQIDLKQDSGLFSNPSCSPLQPDGGFMIAYLQALLADQSATSRYRLFVMDQDGSNQTPMFPAPGSPGLEPQNIFWSPDFTVGKWIAVLYDGNIYLIDTVSAISYQVTTDGLVTGLHWR